MPFWKNANQNLKENDTTCQTDLVECQTELIECQTEPVEVCPAEPVEAISTSFNLNTYYLQLNTFICNTELKKTPWEK